MSGVPLKPYSVTVDELARHGADGIPDVFVPACHLIFSSPATLAYNSPGAIGFGVKRAALVIPESVMLLVSPLGCARNSTVLSAQEGYAERLFYLMMSESDLVTGNHLAKISLAIKDILSIRKPAPKVVVVCITCVDALMGTDLVRVCRQAQQRCGVIVVPSYMYALEREGQRPPMSEIRTTIYSLLERRQLEPAMVNILGFFTALDPQSELFALLRRAGVRKVNQVASMSTLDEYYTMGAANFNLVLNPESRAAAEDLKRRLGMPYVELARLYDPERIHRQYQLFAAGIGMSFDDTPYFLRARKACAAFRERHAGTSFAVGEMANADPFELSCALVTMGMRVKAIFSNVSAWRMPYIRRLASLSPKTRVFVGISPTMLHYSGNVQVDASIGKDAGGYCLGSVNVAWMSESQPFGYRGLIDLLAALDAALGKAAAGAQAIEPRAAEARAAKAAKAPESAEARAAEAAKAPESAEARAAKAWAAVRARAAAGVQESAEAQSRVSISYGACGATTAGKRDRIENEAKDARATGASVRRDAIRGFYRFLAPFAPDQSGAVSVLFELGGMTVVCDAGGCAGNICGFDEPRWFTGKSAIFSAGLRDMDAIFGRDDRLLDKLGDALKTYRPDFIALVGTPVPSVIATDYQALCRVVERRYGLPALYIPTTGMELYERGAYMAYKAVVDLIDRARKEREDRRKTPAAVLYEHLLERDARAGQVVPDVGIWGATPLDLPAADSVAALQSRLNLWNLSSISYGMSSAKSSGSSGLAAYLHTYETPQLLAVSPAGLMMAKLVSRRCSATLDTGLILSGGSPSADALSASLDMLCTNLRKGERTLVVHQQALANDIRKATSVLHHGPVDVASFFRMDQSLMQQGDVYLKGEAELMALVRERDYRLVIADPLYGRLIHAMPSVNAVIAPLPHFAVSGEVSAPASELTFFRDMQKVVSP